MSPFTNDVLVGLLRSFPVLRPPVIVESWAVREQYRFPRSGKARIRRKWAKRGENWRPCRRALLEPTTNTLFCHPMVAADIRMKMEVKP